MKLFLDVNIDWMGKAKVFMALSVGLLLLGGASIWKKGGLRYGIDFKGGTMVYVRFAQTPPTDQIRKGLDAQGLGASSTIQEIQDIAKGSTNEVMIVLQEQSGSDDQLDAGKRAILEALHKTFGGGEANKQDLNAATAASLGDTLARRDPLALGPASGDRYKELSLALTRFRDTQRSGLIANFDELASVSGSNAAVVSALRENYYLGTFVVRNVEIVGPKVGADLRKQAVWATLWALAGMLVYIALRFELVYGAAAVAAVFHDVVITLGLFSVFNFEISLTVIAALLTLVGYSMNDTIVIFDRVRENLRLMRREPLAVIVNRSINQTLSRTFLTSGLTFLTAAVLFLMGGEVLRSFSFALVVGIVIGTYSSFGIAAPLVVAWSHWRGQAVPAGAGNPPNRAANRVAAAK